MKAKEESLSPKSKMRINNLQLESRGDPVIVINGFPVTYHSPLTKQPSNYIKPSSKLKNRKIPVIRGSMTEIDFMNRQCAIDDIKESTRKLVCFTIKNLKKEKPVVHFINEKYINDSKSEEFEHYYELLQNLGEGSSSVVKLCRNKSTTKQYAVKIFRAFDDEYINFAKNEFNNMKAVDSEFVAKVYEMFYDQNKCKIYTVMEYCKGKTLYLFVKEHGRLSDSIVRAVSYGIIEGVIAMHKSGIAHRDLKVDNIMIEIAPKLRDSDYNNIKIFGHIKIKIIDLNVSRSKVNLSYDGTSKKNMIMYSISGTPHYSAPELLECLTCYTEQVDLWSVGCLIYYMIRGHTPFKGTTTKEIINEQRNFDFKFTENKWFGISYDLKKLLSGLLCYKWTERLSAEQALNSGYYSIFKLSFLTKPLKSIKYSKTRASFANNEKNVNIDMLLYLMSVASVSTNNRSKSQK